MSPDLPILTIAIPTWNRARYLQLNLDQLAKEIASCGRGLVELLISDNACEDETQAVVEVAIDKGVAIRYIRNQANIGSDANIAQCFNLALGRYVLILGDDDLLVDEALPWLLDKLQQNDFGVVCLRTYGYDNDFRLEYPRTSVKEKEYAQSGAFLAAAGPLTALISSCVINKKILGATNAMEFCGGNLVQVHLVFRAAIKAKLNLMTGKYCVAYKRNNWGYYDFSKVFVTEFGKILDQYQDAGLNATSVRNIETKLLFSYFPFYIWKQRLDSSGDLSLTRQRFSERFGKRLLFKMWIAPLLVWPRPIALLWGGVAIFIGRSLSGDFRRGLWFIWNKIRRWGFQT